MPLLPPDLWRETAANTQRDIVRRTDAATALISPRWWPNNHGHVLVVPNAHHENLYELPARYGHAVHDLVQQIAVAIRRTYGCDGTSLRQHNEPAGNQDAWHSHVHVFPRYDGDELYGSAPYQDFVPAERRWPYAQKLRRYFGGLCGPAYWPVDGPALPSFDKRVTQLDELAERHGCRYSGLQG